MKIVGAVVIVLCLVCTGCREPSQNQQRAAARATGDNIVTFYLDARVEHDVDEKKKRVVAIVTEIEKLLDQGTVGELTVGALRKQVNEIVPIGYNNISDTVLQYLAGYRVPTDKIPPKIVKNIKAALKGVKTGVAEYKLEDRLPE